MAVKKIGKSWWIDFCFRKQRYRRRSPLNTKNGARDYEVVMRARLARGEPVDGVETTPPPTLDEFAPVWLERHVRGNNKPSEQAAKNYRMRRHLLPAFGELPLDKIDLMRIERFKAKKRRAALSDKTINNILNVLRKCLVDAHDWQLLSEVPKIVFLKYDLPDPDFLSFQEASKLLLDDNEARYNDMVSLALGTGMRIGEICALRWQDIDFEHSKLTVARTCWRGHMTSPKGVSIRHIPLPDQLLSRLQRLPRSSEYVFPNQSGSPMADTTARGALRRICAHTGVRPVAFHVLRHTFGTHACAKGIPIRVVQSILGHKNIKMTLRYSHVADDIKRRAMEVASQPGATWNLEQRQYGGNIQGKPAKARLVA